MSTSTVIVLVVIGILIVWAIGVYNSLVSMRQRVNQAYADIDVQLKQRHDLVPNLVETVKGYAAHERGTLEAVIKARNTAVAAQGPAAQAAAEGVLQGALRQLLVVAEAYPDLKANQNFQQLHALLFSLLLIWSAFLGGTFEEIVGGAARQFARSWPVALVAGLVWFAVAYLVHQSLVSLATGAKGVPRAAAPKLYNVLENLC